MDVASVIGALGTITSRWCVNSLVIPRHMDHLRWCLRLCDEQKGADEVWVSLKNSWVPLLLYSDEEEKAAFSQTNTVSQCKYHEFHIERR